MSRFKHKTDSGTLSLEDVETELDVKVHDIHAPLNMVLVDFFGHATHVQVRSRCCCPLQLQKHLLFPSRICVGPAQLGFIWSYEPRCCCLRYVYTSRPRDLMTAPG